MRTGSELLQATKPFAVEDRATTWRLLIETALVILACAAGIVLAPWLLVKFALAVVLGLTQVRLFIFFHDAMHGAIFRGSKAGQAVMSIIGFFMLSVRSVWRETHNYHHKHNAKLIGSTIGSFPVLTVGMWNGLDERRRRAYRLARHPAVIFGGYLAVFILGMSVSAFRRAQMKHWGGPVALALHTLAIVVWGLTVGWLNAAMLVVVPLVVTHGVGTYLFYAQHNFPDIKLKGRRDWDYTFAALRSSSMFEMSPLMHWFTGNIGYHHVHHLNHRIPFYRLPEAMAAVPELQNPGRTSWRLSDVRACLSLGVWDPDQERMLTWSEVG